MKQQNLRIGTAGWSYEDWEGMVYPHPKPHGFDPLEYLSAYFDVLEINNTFYRPPAPGMGHSWVRRVESNPNFRFTLKLFNKFTHVREGIMPDDISAFKSGIRPVADSGRLGCILIQFPWSFRFLPSSLNYLKQLFDWFGEYQLVVEIRNAAWNNDEFYHFLLEHDVGFCNIDQPRLRGLLEATQNVTSPIGYVRLHGRNYESWFREDAGRDERYNYLYSTDELKDWIESIRRIAAEAVDTYIIANNHYRGQAAVNALELEHMLSDEPVDVPEPLITAYPRLKPIAKTPPRQTELF